jgi:hypothetical protein
MPVWWRWVYWANPAAWTVYGLMFSQLGDRTEQILVPGLGEHTVREFLEEYLGLQDRYFELVTCLHLAIIGLFASSSSLPSSTSTSSAGRKPRRLAPPPAAAAGQFGMRLRWLQVIPDSCQTVTTS